jgi:hypothetical protein
MTEAIRRYSSGELKVTAGSAFASGEVTTAPDGTPAVVAGVGAGVASGEEMTINTDGVFSFASASAVVFAAGDDVHWDSSGNTAITGADAVAADFKLGTAVKAKASGDLTVITRLNPILGEDGDNSVVKIKRIAINADVDNTEQDTGFTLPTKCAVIDVWIDVTTADSGETMDIGTDGTSNDPDGFLDGISVNATGVIGGLFVSTTGSNNTFFAAAGAPHTIGALLATFLAGEDITAGGDGSVSRRKALGAGGDNVTFTMSASTSTMRGSIYIEYVELP